MDIKYVEVTLNDVMRHFAKDFKVTGKTVERSDWFIDSTKGVVVFKLYTEEKPAEVVAPDKFGAGFDNGTILCRGAISLSTGCGKCRRCLEQLEAMRKAGEYIPAKYLK